jgi:hypothetical protein
LRLILASASAPAPHNRAVERRKETPRPLWAALLGLRQTYVRGNLGACYCLPRLAPPPRATASRHRLAPPLRPGLISSLMGRGGSYFPRSQGPALRRGRVARVQGSHPTAALSCLRTGRAATGWVRERDVGKEGPDNKRPSSNRRKEHSWPRSLSSGD